MATLEEGSLAWSRSSPGQKFWPSIVFHSWEAASKAGFVPDGIAFLIEFGRKVDITDAEAAPPKGELLNLYLGESAEWEFIPANETYVLPFEEHRAALARQRLGAQMKHHFGPALAAADAIMKGRPSEPGGSKNTRPPTPGSSSKRPGVLLDFGTGTSFSSFAELWNYLLHNGWGTSPGKGLASWHYFPPGSDPKKRNSILDEDYFTSEEMVINYVRRTGLERPAPVTTVVKKSRRSSSSTPSQRTNSRTADVRPNAGKRSQSTTPVSSSGKRRSSPASAPSAQAKTKSTEPSSVVARSSVKVAVAASATVKDGRSNKGNKNKGDAPVRSKDRGKVSARTGAGADARSAVERDSVRNFDDLRTKERQDDGGGVELFFTADEGQKGGRGDSQGAETIGDSDEKDHHSWRSDRQEDFHVGPKRSHGRTMVVEAANMSSARGSPPNIVGEVTRQAVTARSRASSPPAPSPSKRPKRRPGPSPIPHDLARLAKKQIKQLCGLLAGTERPYPGPCGLDEPISEIAGFVRESHNAWRARQAGSGGPASRARCGLVIAGRSGTGKSTAFQAAMRSVATEDRAATLRFVTIKCAQIYGNPNEVFSSILAAVTGSSMRVDADSALEVLSRLDEPPPSLPVICLDYAERLKPFVLQRLLSMAAQGKALFAVVCLVGSLDMGEEIVYNQGCLERDCSLVAMLGCKEDQLRAILGQTLGAASPEDKDGELIASLVNKGALDVIAKTVARVCGSARIALNVCEVAFAERLLELDQMVGGTSALAVATRPSMSSSGGADSTSACFSQSPSCSSSLNSGAGALNALLTVAGAKAALNKYLVQRPEAVWGGEAEEQTPP